MKATHIGDLQDRIAVLCAAIHPDGRGGYTCSWQHADTLWSLIVPRQGSARGDQAAKRERIGLCMPCYQLRVRSGYQFRSPFRIGWGKLFLIPITTPTLDISRQWLDFEACVAEGEGHE